MSLESELDGRTAAGLVLTNLRSILKRRQAEPVELTDATDLYADLELDSLEVAELSVALEEELGKDPYSEGLTPRTIGQVIEFYES
jgi:acyl carrier protein